MEEQIKIEMRDKNMLFSRKRKYDFLFRSCKFYGGSTSTIDALPHNIPPPGLCRAWLNLAFLTPKVPRSHRNYRR
jgi:uncharacterized Fe-S cluster-containing radical SAM superfamily protein